MTRRRFDVFDNGSVGSERGKAQESNMLRNSFFLFSSENLQTKTSQSWRVDSERILYI